MTAWLVTVIFLLSNGAPANKAHAECAGVRFHATEEDDPYAADEYERVLVDSRGGVIFTLHEPTTIRCWAVHSGQRWEGEVVFERGVRVIRKTLK